MSHVLTASSTPFSSPVDQYKLVVEALRERRIFLETAPYLSKMLPCVSPSYLCGSRSRLLIPPYL